MFIGMLFLLLGDNLTEQQALDFLRLQQEKREKAADKKLSDSEDSSSCNKLQLADKYCFQFRRGASMN